MNVHRNNRKQTNQTRLRSKVFSLEMTLVDFVLERGQIFFGGGGEEVGKLKQTLPFC